MCGLRLCLWSSCAALLLQAVEGCLKKVLTSAFDLDFETSTERALMNEAWPEHGRGLLSLSSISPDSAALAVKLRALQLKC